MDSGGFKPYKLPEKEFMDKFKYVPLVDPLDQMVPKKTKDTDNENENEKEKEKVKEFS